MSSSHHHRSAFYIPTLLRVCRKKANVTRKARIKKRKKKKVTQKRFPFACRAVVKKVFSSPFESRRCVERNIWCRKIYYIILPQNLSQRRFRAQMNSREGINEERVPTSIPSQKMTIQTTNSLSENNNKENNNIDSFIAVVAGKMSASGSAATSATATAATARPPLIRRPESSRKTKALVFFCFGKHRTRRAIQNDVHGDAE